MSLGHPHPVYRFLVFPADDRYLYSVNVRASHETSFETSFETTFRTFFDDFFGTQSWPSFSVTILPIGQIETWGFLEVVGNRIS